MVFCPEWGVSVTDKIMEFFSLMSTAISSIFYGIVATVALMAILYAVLKALGNGIVETTAFYLTGAVLAVLLIIQFSLMIGAFGAKDAVESAQLYMNQLLEGQEGIIGANESQQIFDQVTAEYPLIRTYIGVVDFSGNDLSNLSESMCATMTDYLKSYIWRRVFWILGMLAVALTTVFFFAKPNANLGRRRAPADRHDGRRARTGSHQRVSRRR